jgi:serine/threonine protein kinase/Tol biopolymer transport system component
MTDAARWTRVKSIFDAAVACEGEVRAALLRERCGDDRALRDDVESLLAADRDRGNRLEQPVPSGLRGLALATLAGGDQHARPLTPGTRIGAYTITGVLGAGGMGEVYRAQDTTLDREVAVKILPYHWMATPKHRARFEREARLLATLNHPNIGAIYGVAESDGIRGLVLELVDGETLAERIARERSASRGIRAREALSLARQLAEALEAAHERGIVHRDLKPANIKINADGRLKVLDFGIATLQDAQDGNDVAVTGELTGSQSERSALFGTIPYMSPEQARGEPVDRRTDVWAFGCVLYEMLTGTRAFDGVDAAETLSRVLYQDPDLSRIPPDVPSAIRRVIVGCLDKERTRRLPHVSIARFEIEEVLAAPVPSDDIGGRSRPRSVPALALAVALGTFAGLILAWVGLPRSLPVSSPMTRLLVDLAPAEQIGGTDGRPSRTAFALSPDGMTLVFSAIRGNRRSLFVRRLDRAEAVALEATDGAENPFFSPDGRWIGYWADAAIRKAPLSGGHPVTVAEATLVYGASWGDDDRIVFSAGAGLMEVPAGGGVAVAVTAVNTASGEVSHRLPHVLPGGDAVLFTITTNRFPRWDEAQIAVYSRRTDTTKVLVAGGADARYVSSGHLVYVREGLLLAVPFDLQRLELSGGPVGMVADVMQAAYFRGQPEDAGASQFAMSSTGTLVYVTGGTTPPAERSLARVNRSGRSVTLPIAPRPFVTLRLSPDGDRIALNTFGRDRDVWVYSIGRGTLGRLSAEGRKGAPIWTPDGERITYPVGISGSDALQSIRADGAGSPEPIVQEGQDLVPATWTPDARQLLYYLVPPSAIRVHDIARRGPPATVHTITGDVVVGGADISPDGRWIAYHSGPRGRHQVYVQAYPEGVPRYQISADGGTLPVWRRNGRELFYIRENNKPAMGSPATDVTMMVVPIETRPTFTFGAPRELFTGAYAMNRPARTYDVTADGEHFYLLELRDRPPDRITQLNVVQNWFEELRRLVPAK